MPHTTRSRTPLVPSSSPPERGGLPPDANTENIHPATIPVMPLPCSRPADSRDIQDGLQWGVRGSSRPSRTDSLSLSCTLPPPCRYDGPDQTFPESVGSWPQPGGPIADIAAQPVVAASCPACRQHRRRSPLPSLRCRQWPRQWRQDCRTPIAPYSAPPPIGKTLLFVFRKPKAGAE
jgi:hypothetical protein